MAAMTFIEKFVRDEGRNEGRHEAKLETARRLREMGMADIDIHRATCLSLEEIGSL